jgi:transcriptional regulator with XRE-family HTH domain
MGVRRRMQCERLAEKLLAIREGLQLSQSDLLERLQMQARLGRQNISSYEKGATEPPLPVLLGYARLAGVCAEVLIDDALDLPKTLPAKPKHKP